MDDTLTGTAEAAALHGVAMNGAYTLNARFHAAMRALEIYEDEFERLEREEPLREFVETVLKNNEPPKECEAKFTRHRPHPIGPDTRPICPGQWKK